MGKFLFTVGEGLTVTVPAGRYFWDTVELSPWRVVGDGGFSVEEGGRGLRRVVIFERRERIRVGLKVSGAGGKAICVRGNLRRHDSDEREMRIDASEPYHLYLIPEEEYYIEAECRGLGPFMLLHRREEFFNPIRKLSVGPFAVRIRDEGGRSVVAVQVPKTPTPSGIACTFAEEESTIHVEVPEAPNGITCRYSVADGFPDQTDQSPSFALQFVERRPDAKWRELPCSGIRQFAVEGAERFERFRENPIVQPLSVPADGTRELQARLWDRGQLAGASKWLPLTVSGGVPDPHRLDFVISHRNVGCLRVHVLDKQKKPCNDASVSLMRKGTRSCSWSGQTTKDGEAVTDVFPCGDYHLHVLTPASRVPLTKEVQITSGTSVVVLSLADIDMEQVHVRFLKPSGGLAWYEGQYIPGLQFSKACTIGHNGRLRLDLLRDDFPMLIYGIAFEGREVFGCGGTFLESPPPNGEVAIRVGRREMRRCSISVELDDALLELSKDRRRELWLTAPTSVAPVAVFKLREEAQSAKNDAKTRCSFVGPMPVPNGEFAVLFIVGRLTSETREADVFYLGKRDVSPVGDIQIDLTSNDIQKRGTLSDINAHLDD